MQPYFELLCLLVCCYIRHLLSNTEFNASSHLSARVETRITGARELVVLNHIPVSQIAFRIL